MCRLVLVDGKLVFILRMKNLKKLMKNKQRKLTDERETDNINNEGEQQDMTKYMVGDWYDEIIFLRSYKGKCSFEGDSEAAVRAHH